MAASWALDAAFERRGGGVYVFGTLQSTGRVAHPFMGGGVDDDSRLDRGYVIVHALSLAPL